jgi:hypothetical protein
MLHFWKHRQQKLTVMSETEMEILCGQQNELGQEDDNVIMW